jgi:hypothetical protein
MKFFPSKDTMEKWEFLLTIVITLIIGAELLYAKAGFRETKDQISILGDLKNASKDQSTIQSSLVEQQKQSLQSLTQMNEKLQTSVKKTTDMASAMQQQLAILQEEQGNRLAEAAKKPKLELQVGNVPVNTFFTVPIKAKEETDTKSVFALRLFNNGDGPARHGTLRVIVNGKDISIQSSSPFQKPYEEPDSEVQAILINFDVVRSHGNVGMDITVNYPKGQKPFPMFFNVDADELATGTSLGAMTVRPRKPLD